MDENAGFAEIEEVRTGVALMLWLLVCVRAMPASVDGAEAEDEPATQFEDTAAGDLLRVNGAPVKNATVRLQCVTTATPSDDNHFRSRCESTLRVERNGRVVAELDSGVFGIDYEQVAGNHGLLALTLVDLDGGSLIAVRAASRLGDMWSKDHVDEQLFAVDKKTLREVYRWCPLEAYEPGPDGPDSERKRDVAELTVAPHNTLVLKDGDTETRVTWDGHTFVPLDVTPLVRRALDGQRLTATELTSFSVDDLTKLRNAPYARHGRPFKNAALQQYFYTTLGRTAKPSFTERQLDAADRANVALVTAEMRSR